MKRSSRAGARWSEAQYKSYIAKTGGTSKLPPKKSSPLPRKKNQTESEFELWFRFKHPSITMIFEPIKLRIDASCWYTPDFWCPEFLCFYEVKGPHIFEDAVIKFKAARALHPWARFEMWQRWLGEWRQIRKLPGDKALD